jgi:hypothetical protein
MASASKHPAEGKSNIMDCTPAELEEIIRCTITTGPWNDSDSKDDTGNSKQDSFRGIVERMRQRGYRITTGEEYYAELRRRQNMRPDVIPLWKPIHSKDAYRVSTGKNKCVLLHLWVAKRELHFISKVNFLFVTFAI